MADERRKGKTLPEIAALFGVGQYDMHFLLCVGTTCCTDEVGRAAWEALKAKTRALYPKAEQAKVYRSKADCLRMCQDGPIAVCYPQGRWFRGVTAEQVPGLVDHLVSGNPEPHPLEFAANPFGDGKPSP
jgi:(2Fe-2S) ferredoxin